ncbi:MAG: hypothetical protein HYU87_10780 [Chloroflexi bacterium]|nr:hypothetical protein [Chloroflexota bacterium]
MGEGPHGTWIRWAAATMAVAAGAVHVAQVSVHTDEDPLFGMFFVVVAVLQLAGGAYLARPIGPPALVRAVLTFGIGGSLATIGIWAVSRTFGLPFGAEPGEAEEVGVADAAANMFELFTALFLFLWLRQERMAERSWLRWTVVGASAALGLAALWVALRALEVLDPDPRLVLEPGFADLAAVGFLVVTGLFFVQLALWRARPATRLGSVAPVAILFTLALVELPLVAFTVPARGGQNIECRYAPIAEDSGLGHAKLPPSIEIDVGERRSVVVLLLTVCDTPAELVDATPLQPPAGNIRITSVSVDRARSYRTQRVRELTSASSVPLRGVVMRPGEGRYPVTVEVEALSAGEVVLGAFRVEYVSGGVPSSFGFASFTRFCVDRDACAEGR